MLRFSFAKNPILKIVCTEIACYNIVNNHDSCGFSNVPVVGEGGNAMQKPVKCYIYTRVSTAI